MRSGVNFIRSQRSSFPAWSWISLPHSSLGEYLLPYFAQYVLHVNEVAYGWLASAASVGAVTWGL